MAASRVSVGKLLTSNELAQNRRAVLGVYHYLLRSIGLAFNGDETTKQAALGAAREGFQRNKELEVGGDEALRQIEHAQGVATILRENIVQGKNVGEDTYKLRIHEETQRGENATAAKMKGTTKSFKQIKDALF